MKLERLPGESNLDFHKRLICGKLVDKSLADVDYSELSEYVYGRVYSSDVARRMMYGSCQTLQLMDEEAVTNATSAPDLDGKIHEFKKEQKKLFDQRREYSKLVVKTARTEHLIDRLIEAAEALPHSVGDVFAEDHSYVAVDDTEAILVLCDWHYGMVTENIWNTYNTEICRERVSHVVRETAERLALHKCSKLHVVVLGDLIHGAIHTSARVASEELVCDQLMHVSEILAQAIEYLNTYIDDISVYMTYGNHARTVQKKDDSIHSDNMEQIIPWWLSQRLKGHEGIHIFSDFGGEIMHLSVCGYGICASHGDLDSVKSSPQLFATLYQKKYGKEVDYVLLADKHHRESFEELGISSMICGALCGTDEYANRKRLYSTPEQLLLIVNSEVGVDAEYHIRCGG